MKDNSFSTTGEGQIIDSYLALNSEVSGRTQIFNYLLKNIGDYLSQLEAEVDGNKTAEKYLELTQLELAKVATLVAEEVKMNHAHKVEFEIINLVQLLENLKKRLAAISPFKIQLQLPENREALVRGSVEELLLSLIYLVMNNKFNDDVYISLEKKELSEATPQFRKSSLKSGEFWAIFISNSQAPLEPYLPLLYSNNHLVKNKLFQRNGTIALGNILNHQGEIFGFDHECGAVSLALLIPSVDNSALEGSDDASLENVALHGTETILVVDDQDMIWEILIENLQELGYTVILAENGLDAVEIYRENPGFIDLVILDMVMPKMNGREAFVELKKLDNEVKVLLSSGFMAEGEAGDLLESGAKGFLRKPYKMFDLAKKIREILD